MQSRSKLICGLLLLAAVGFALQRSRQSEFIGIDFVQFRLTGQHLRSGGDARVWAPDVRNEILESAWQQVQPESAEPKSKLFHAVNFRHERSWETYSSPFLYSVFAVGESGKRRAESREETATQYDRELKIYHGICIGSTVIGLLGFGWFLRVPGSALLLTSLALVWFSPLRIDLNVANVNQIQLGMVGVLVFVLCGGNDLRRSSNLPYVVRGEKSRRRSDGCTVRHFIAGLWLGLCLAFKPSLLWVALMWIGYLVSQWVNHRRDAVDRSDANVTDAGQGRERLGQSFHNELVMLVLGGLTGGTLAVAFSLFWFPMSAWFDWIQAVRAMPDDIIQTTQGNFSPTYFAQHSLGLPSAFLILAGPLLALVSVIGFSRYPKPFSADDRHLRMMPWLIAGLQIHLLTSHLVWYHYCVLSLPAVLWTFTLSIHSRDKALRILYSAAAVWCLALLGLEPIDRLLDSPPEEHCLRCLCANLLLLLMVVLPTADRHSAANC